MNIRHGVVTMFFVVITGLFCGYFITTQKKKQFLEENLKCDSSETKDIILHYFGYSEDLSQMKYKDNENRSQGWFFEWDRIHVLSQRDNFEVMAKFSWNYKKINEQLGDFSYSKTKYFKPVFIQDIEPLSFDKNTGRYSCEARIVVYVLDPYVSDNFKVRLEKKNTGAGDEFHRPNFDYMQMDADVYAVPIRYKIRYASYYAEKFNKESEHFLKIEEINILNSRKIHEIKNYDLPEVGKLSDQKRMDIFMKNNLQTRYGNLNIYLDNRD